MNKQETNPNDQWEIIQTPQYEWKSEESTQKFSSIAEWEKYHKKTIPAKWERLIEDNEEQLISKQCEMCWQYTTKWYKHLTVLGHRCIVLEGFKHPAGRPYCLFSSIRGSSVAQNNHNHIVLVCTSCIKR